jgi:outer membrane murein-binding lipoprotein Lpp
MRTKLAILAMALALAGCGKPHTQTAQSADPNVQQLDAQAKQLEAEANRLEAQAGQPAAAAAPSAAPADNGATALAAGDEKLSTGQYYDTISVNVQAGQSFNVVYDAHGYQPVMIVLGPDNKPDSQSQGPTPDPTSGVSHVENETKADRSGVWHVLLSSLEPGATGAYGVRVDTETPVG